MKRHPAPSRSTPAARALLALMIAGSAHSLNAASQTWSTTAVDSTWTNTANWAAGAVPGATYVSGNTVNNDVVTFNSSLVNGTIGGVTDPIQIDLNRIIGGITFTGASVGPYVIGTTAGNELKISHNGTIQLAADVVNAQIINAPLAIRLPSSTNGVYTFANNATNTNATLTFGGPIIANQNSTTRPLTLNLSGSNTGNNTIAGAITTAGTKVDVVKAGAGTWILSGANDFGSNTSATNAGSVTINAGTLIANNSAALSTNSTANAIGVAINNTGTLEIGNGAIIDNGVSLNLNTGGTIRGNGAAATNGRINLATAAATTATLSTVGSGDVFTIGNAANDLTGGAADTIIQVTGPGTVLLSQDSNYAGNWSLNAGTTKLGTATSLGATTSSVSFGSGSTAKLQLNGNSITVGGLSTNATAGTPVVENGAAGTATLTVNNSSANTYAGTLQDGSAGVLALTKSGAGTLSLSGANTYTGGTTISGGTLNATSSGALGTGAVSVGSSATLAANTLNIGDLTMGGGGNILLTDFNSHITSSGTVSISGSTNLLTLGGSLASAGSTYTLLSAGSLSASGISLTGAGVGGLTIAVNDSATVGRTTYAFTSTLTSLQLTISGGAFNLTWNGGSANWNATDANWQKDGTGSNIAFVAGDNITIGTADTIGVDAGGITAGTLAVTNASGSTTLNGGSLNVLSVTKSGAGTLQINNALTSNGATTVNAGTVAIGATGSLTSGSIAVNGGTLDIGTSNTSAASVSLTSGSIAGTTGVLTGTGSAFDVQSGNVSAILAGSVGLTKTTSGTVTLSGTNTYTGATAVNAGTLAVSGSGTLGNGGALTLGGGALALGGTSQTVGAVSVTTAAASGNTIENGSVTGSSYAVSNASGNAIVTASLLANASAGLDKTGAGTLTLSGANTYTGSTNVKNGSLVLDGGDNRLLSGGSVVLGDTGTTGKFVLGGSTVANQTLTSLTTAGSGGSVVGGNAANSTLTLDISGASTVSTTLGGAGTNENNLALAKSGVGTLTLSSANTYAGGTTVNAGTMSFNSSTAAGSGTITALNGTTINAAAGVGSNNLANAITLSGTNANVTLTNANASGGYTGSITGTADQTLTISNSSGQNVNFNAQNTQQFQNFLGTISIASGSTLAFRASSGLNNGGSNTLFDVNGGLTTRNGGAVALGGLTGSGTVNLGGSGGSVTFTIGGRGGNDTFSGVISDNSATNTAIVVKTGSGTQTFSGANTYTGATTISAGTLALGASGSIASASIVNNSTFDVSAVSGYAIGSGQTLSGSGTVIGATVVNGTLNPGNSPGVLTFNNDLTLAGTTNVEINSATRGTGHDGVNVGGTLTYGGVLNVLFGSPFIVGTENFQVFTGLDGSSLPLLNSPSFTSIILGGSYTASLTNNSGVWTGSVDGVDFTFTESTGTLAAIASAVPEPATYAMLAGLAIFGVAALRRRRA